ncbi:GatB/YqeY domain-containing protein [Rhizodiscina lignyota]|uniref:Altered inheritance of mitochondria protein 41 n=1 Tax=Rhizodiscina lignyota TaxID=1504668 RepID=A0A9P4ID87_9PEZI|nr:GatB/YqeY domain-containing protein [Rhizodiscina lignyota]
MATTLRFAACALRVSSSRSITPRASNPSSICQKCLRAFSSSQRRSSTAPSPASPILVKLRGDLKSAMRAKDTARLSVLRALLADITNASKTSSPITTNPQFLSLLRKRLAAAETAVEEFKSVSRQDLVDKEEGQMEVLQGYVKDVGGDTMNPEELKSAIEEVVEEMKAQGKVVMGEALKKLLGPGGKLEGKGADGKEVAKVVRSMIL